MVKVVETVMVSGWKLVSLLKKEGLIGDIFSDGKVVSINVVEKEKSWSTIDYEITVEKDIYHNEKLKIEKSVDNLYLGKPVAAELHEGEEVLTVDAVKEYTKTIDKLNEPMGNLKTICKDDFTEKYLRVKLKDVQNELDLINLTYLEQAKEREDWIKANTKVEYLNELIDNLSN